MNKLILSTLVITMVTTPLSWAKNNHNEKSHWAKVTNVEPITRVVEQRIPHEECWDEPVRYSQHTNNNKSHTGTIIGTIIGGAIGNKVSHNKKAGTIIGAVLGASVGHDISKQGYSHSSTNIHYSNQRHCQVTHKISYQETVIGYNVWYRYQGSQYKTRMDNHPGKRIKVSVSVKPY